MEKKFIVLSLIKMVDVIEKAKQSRLLPYSDIEKEVTPCQNEVPISEISINKNINLIGQSAGIEMKKMLAKEKFIIALSEIPYIEKGYHTVLYGKPGLGKTYKMDNVFFPMSKSISGDITNAQLFGSAREHNPKPGILEKYLIIGFDDSQLFKLPIETKAKLYSFLSTGIISRGNENDKTEKEKRVETSIVFIGNFSEEKEEFLKEKSYEFSKESFNDFLPEDFNTKAFKERVIIIPTWLVRDYPLIKDNTTMGIPVNNLISIYKKLREEKEIKSDFNLEKRIEYSAIHTFNGLYKLFNLTSYLGDNNEKITTEADIEAFKFLAEKIVTYPFTDKKFTLVGNKNVNQFWIKLSEDFMPYSINSITEAYVNEYRIILRFSEEPEALYKIAIDRKGIELNKKELDIYNSSSNFLKEYLVPVYKDSENFERVKCSTTFSNFSTYERLKDISIFKSNQLSLNKLIEKIDNPEILKCFITLKEYTENEIRNLKMSQKELKKSYENILKECTTSYQRIAIPEYKLSEEEKENFFFQTVDELSKITETPKEEFKKYHFVWSEKERKLSLLSYNFLQKIDYGLYL